MRTKILTALVLLSGCGLLISGGCPQWQLLEMDDGPIAKNIAAALGEAVPSATEEQLATFERGKQVLQRRFLLSEGLGPTFNLTSCGGCHEKPVAGGKAGLYRNFFLAGRKTADGAFVFSESNGNAGGVLRVFHYGDDSPARPAVPATTTVFAQRNAIPMFGVGLVAEIPDDEILLRADPDDADGDGISGRPNYDRGFVGRFGRKCQTVSIEGFIRGPLFNHLGLTTVPLTEEQRAKLPVDSSAVAKQGGSQIPFANDDVDKIDGHSQAAAADGPNFDADLAADPEMTGEELFDLVSFSMLLAAPKFDEPTIQSNRGRLLFHEANCSACHTPRLNGPRGPIPAYSDFLLHDMGEALADGIVMKLATGSEFRTQPLWGISAAGPYLHDGRALTLEEAILAHAGEAQAARDAFDAFSAQEKADVIEFLLSLGGRGQASAGLLPPNAEIPAVGEYGGPVRELSEEELAQFERGRALYDRDFGFSEGAGAMTGANGATRFNGDSCRACHSDPVIGGAGPRDVNVMRHGIIDQSGNFAAPATTFNTILHKEIALGQAIVTPEPACNIFEHRQTPHNFGLGLIDTIPESEILSHADPTDADGDGISGRAHILANGRLGRLGWKADVPSVEEFVRDAMAAEIGLTVESQDGLSFGLTSDADAVPDPELSASDADDLAFFMLHLAPPPRQSPSDPALVLFGEQVFASVGCTKCHVPAMSSELGTANLFSDLLLHEILPADQPGIVSGDAGQREFRTAPLWGLSKTAPYFHTGEADTIDAAVRLHDGEAAGVRQAYEALSEADRAALLAFLGTL
ncbi:MAG: hypothetical protein CHACPFDD_04008 [Phycisphaerae bacterium]|nr:hypothetical protein [Phycisphaerae bacterium]